MAEGKVPGDKVSQKPKPRFHLRFSQPLEIGRSQFSVPRLPNFYAPTITSKFYSAHDALIYDKDDKEIRLIQEEISKTKLLGPREKYEEPILESQKYGWIHEKYIEFDPKTDRIHFPKKTSEMVKIQNLLYNVTKADQLYNKIKSNSK